MLDEDARIVRILSHARLGDRGGGGIAALFSMSVHTNPEQVQQENQKDEGGNSNQDVLS